MQGLWSQTTRVKLTKKPFFDNLTMGSMWETWLHWYHVLDRNVKLHLTSTVQWANSLWECGGLLSIFDSNTVMKGFPVISSNVRDPWPHSPGITCQVWAMEWCPYPCPYPQQNASIALPILCLSFWLSDIQTGLSCSHPLNSIASWPAE